MISPPLDVGAAVAQAVAEYQAHANIAELLDRLAAIAEGASAEALVAAAEPYRDLPEVAGPLYERVVELRPDDARALVTLANYYWLAGRGSEAVGDLASRAIAADPANRGAWHLWALSESEIRARVARWQQVIARFPDDQLAKAVLADNLASLAGGEHDSEALVLAIATYEELLAETPRSEQRAAIETALKTLKAWKL